MGEMLMPTGQVHEVLGISRSKLIPVSGRFNLRKLRAGGAVYVSLSDLLALMDHEVRLTDNRGVAGLARAIREATR